MTDVAIETPYIQLDQFLKWAGILESGGQIKPLLEDGMILLNGAVASERRKKLYPGDTVAIKGMGEWRVTGK